MFCLVTIRVYLATFLLYKVLYLSYFYRCYFSNFQLFFVVINKIILTGAAIWYIILVTPLGGVERCI